MSPFPVGLIGAGKHGQRYLQHIRADTPELRLVALSRHDAMRGAAQASELGCRFLSLIHISEPTRPY